jgi:hypothetical protein
MKALSIPVAYDKPIPYRGKLGFFDVELLIPSPGP